MKANKKHSGKDEMILMQHGMKNNHEEVNSFVTDLDKWYKEVGEKDKNKQVREAAFQKGVSIQFRTF